MTKLYNEAEEYIKDVFYSDSYDTSCIFNLQSVVHEKLKNDTVGKDVDYYGHKKGVVHVSSLSKCLRGVAYEMLGYKATEEIKDRVLGVFKAGQLFEDFIVDSMGDRVLDRQTEYSLQYKNITLVGRDDGTFLDEKGNRRVLEVKSVHSDSFWYREKEGTLVAYQNQIQLQVYLWLRRKLYNDVVDGMFCYVSKDDCTIVSVPVKYNENIINEIVIPALELLNEAYEKQDASVCPVPDTITFNKQRRQFNKNWLCSYCSYHKLCAGQDWEDVASKEVTAKNKDLKGK